MECQLCLQNKSLKNSHIIPKWCFRLFWDNGKCLITRYDENPSEEVVQGGLKEHLLCQECEALFSTWELHAKEKFFEQAQTARLGSEVAVIVSGLDYAKFKLFQLSVLWRAGVSTLPFFASVRLGQHQERLRNLLVSRNPGEQSDYGCIMTLFRFSEIEKAKPEHLILPPCPMNIDGFRMYRFVMAGAGWLYVVTSHNS